MYSSWWWGDHSQNSNINFTPETSGLYRFQAGSSGKDTGGYELSVKSKDYSEDDLKLNTTYKGNIEQDGDDTDDFFAFFEKDKTYDVRLYGDSTSSNSLSNPYFKGIYNPNNQFLEGYENDDISNDNVNSYTQFTAAETGIHKLVAGSWYTRSGDYELSIMEV